MQSHDKDLWEGPMPFVVYSTYLMPKQTSQPLQQLQLFLYSMCVLLPQLVATRDYFQSTVAILATNAIVKLITNAFLRCSSELCITMTHKNTIVVLTIFGHLSCSSYSHELHPFIVVQLLLEAECKQQAVIYGQCGWLKKERCKGLQDILYVPCLYRQHIGILVPVLC